MSDKETKGEHIEPVGSNGSAAAAGYPLTKKQKAARHCKKFWWLHLLIFICIVVLVVCLIIFVAVPNIAQSRVNSAKLSIQGLSVTQTQADNFTMSINATIKADDSIHAVIDPFEGEMYLEDWEPQTPFVRLAFPQTTSASESVVNVTQFTTPTDMDAFIVFNEWLLANESLKVTVKGNTHVKINGISKKYPITFKKTLNITALDNLNGLTVPNSTVSLTPDDNGDNFKGTAIIPNRSFITLEVGNTTFRQYLLGQDVGYVNIDNLVLYPGNNSAYVRGNISQTPVLQVIQEEPYCQDGVMPFQLQATNVTNHGQYIPYLAESLGSGNQSVSIDVGQDLEALGLTITCNNTSTKRELKAGSSKLLW